MSMDLTRRHFVMAGAMSIALTAGRGWAATAKVTEKDIEIKTPDGSADAVLFHPGSGKGPWPAVILWHDLAGLRPVFRDMARRLASEGYVVLAPNAFYRSTRATGAEINMADAEVRKVQTAYRTAATDEEEDRHPWL
jgi:carboxymethylenebutenolidase